MFSFTSLYPHCKVCGTTHTGLVESGQLTSGIHFLHQRNCPTIRPESHKPHKRDICPLSQQPSSSLISLVTTNLWEIISNKYFLLFKKQEWDVGLFSAYQTLWSNENVYIVFVLDFLQDIICALLMSWRPPVCTKSFSLNFSTQVWLTDFLKKRCMVC